MRAIILCALASWMVLRWLSSKPRPRRPGRGNSVPEPVEISVSEVRREIYKASEFAAGDSDDQLTAIKCPHCGNEDLYHWSARREHTYTAKNAGA